MRGARIFLNPFPRAEPPADRVPIDRRHLFVESRVQPATRRTLEPDEGAVAWLEVMGELPQRGRSISSLDRSDETSIFSSTRAIGCSVRSRVFLPAKTVKALTKRDVHSAMH